MKTKAKSAVLTLKKTSQPTAQVPAMNFADAFSYGVGDTREHVERTIRAVAFLLHRLSDGGESVDGAIANGLGTVLTQCADDVAHALVYRHDPRVEFVGEEVRR